MSTTHTAATASLAWSEPTTSPNSRIVNLDAPQAEWVWERIELTTAGVKVGRHPFTAQRWADRDVWTIHHTPRKLGASSQLGEVTDLADAEALVRAKVAELNARKG